MLRSANEIIGYRFYAKQDDVGTCEDLLFDDRWWTIRHMVANTGNWLVDNLVLVSPFMIEKPDWKSRHILLNITKDALEDCPSPASDEPVSREHEKRIFNHFGYPYYWSGTGLWGGGPFPGDALSAALSDKRGEEDPDEDGKTNHLRSLREITGYDIKAIDDTIGHVEDFILDDSTWALRYLIVDTRNWLPGGKKIMLSLNWAKSVSWEDATFEVDLEKKQIENGPEFDPSQPVNVEKETRLYDYYGRPFEKNIDRQLQQNIANPFI